MPLSARPPFAAFTALTWRHRAHTMRHALLSSSAGVSHTSGARVLTATRCHHATRSAALHCVTTDEDKDRAMVSDTSGSRAVTGAAAAAAAVAASPQSSLRQRALEVGLIASSDERTRTPLSTAGRATLASSAPADNVCPSSSSSADALPRVTDDPLLDFLEKNEEDAAALLAMWTSLTRACLYASEVSESLTLRVRYFLHRLIHQKAIAAAWELYERLVYLGVQLRHSDIALLVTNLPYEQSANDPDTPRSWMREDADALKAREARARRNREIAEESARWRRKSEDAATDRASPAANASPTPTHDAVSPAHEPPTAPLFASTTEPASSVEVHVLANQPEWVKRWLLYEASMGNFNLYESAEEQTRQHTPPAPHAQDGPVADALASDAAAPIWDGLPSQYQATADREDGQQAVRLLELVARIEHLRILQLAPSHVRRTYRVLRRHGNAPQHWRVRRQATTTTTTMSRDFLSTSSSSPLTVSAVDTAATAAAATSFWRDALDSTEHFYAAEKLSSMPPELRHNLRAIILGSRSWQAAMAYCQLLVSLGMPVESVDAVLFLHLSADALPWRSSTAVEAFVLEVILPRLPAQDAASFPLSAPVHAAATVLWLSHLCAVKSTRPEDFVTLLDGTAAVFALPERVVSGEGEMSALVGAVADAAQEATRRYHDAVRAYQKQQKAVRALATSIRAGLFTTAHDGTSDDVAAAHKEQATSMAVAHADGLGLLQDGKDARLSIELVTTLRTLCVSTHEALWLVALAASPRQRASVVALHDVLEHCVYGPHSLWAVYERLYCPPPGDVRALESARAAPERVYVSCIMGRLLSQVLTVVCRQYSQTRAGMGANQTVTITSPTQVALLLDMIETALQPACVRRPDTDVHLEWVAPTQQELTAICGAWPRVLRQIFVYLRLCSPGVSTSSPSNCSTSSHDERVLFGAVTPITTECLARAGRLTLVVNELAEQLAAVGRGSTGEGAPESQPHNSVWQALPFRTRKVFRTCFNKQTTLGKKVRQQMNRKELRQIDALLFPVQRRAAVKGPLRYYAAPTRPLTSARYGTATTAAQATSTPVTVSPTRLDDQSMASVIQLRERATALLLRHANNSAQLNKALSSLVAQSDWAQALQLVHILTDDLRVSPRTLQTPFFRCVMAAMARTVPEAPLPVLVADAPRRSSAARRTRAMNTGGVRGSLWLDAIGVFWKAVDHTSPASSTNDHPGELAPRVVKHERDVFGELLVPMIEFSQAVDRRDLGREWYGAWAGLYARYEKRDAHFRHRSAEALSLLGDASALAQSARLVQDETDTAVGNQDAAQSFSATQAVTEAEAEAAAEQLETRDDAAQHAALVHHDDALSKAQVLLCRVAPRQRQWLKALGTVTAAFGTVDARERAELPYPPQVAAALLAVLAKSPTNLSNTGLRLHQLQCLAAREGPAPVLAWDAACAIGLSEMLVKARRWRRAVDVVAEALALPTMQAVKAAEAGTALAAEPTRQYATLLTLGLQACAIGGLGDTATALYNDFQALETRVCGGATEDTAESCEDADDAVLATRRHVTELSPRARSFFFRGMTKKMFAKDSDTGKPATRLDTGDVL